MASTEKLKTMCTHDEACNIAGEGLTAALNLGQEPMQQELAGVMELLQAMVIMASTPIEVHETGSQPMRYSRTLEANLFFFDMSSY